MKLTLTLDADVAIAPEAESRRSSLPRNVVVNENQRAA
jgi:hypothetical protein